MTDVWINDTGCVITRSGITGDILCRWPGEECDCLMQRLDESYASYLEPTEYEVTVDESFADANGRTVDAETVVTIEARSITEANRLAREEYGNRIFEGETRLAR